jgi:hypothetical protein
MGTAPHKYLFHGMHFGVAAPEDKDFAHRWANKIVNSHGFIFLSAFLSFFILQLSILLWGRKHTLKVQTNGVASSTHARGLHVWSSAQSGVFLSMFPWHTIFSALMILGGEEI